MAIMGRVDNLPQRVDNMSRDVETQIKHQREILGLKKYCDTKEKIL